MKKQNWFRWLSMLAFACGIVLGTTALGAETAPVTDEVQPSVYKAVGLGAAAAFAIAFSVIGASHAVARIGSAAMGAAAEKPELLARSLLFVALAEGLGVLGFAIAMMIVQKI